MLVLIPVAPSSEQLCLMRFVSVCWFISVLMFAGTMADDLMADNIPADKPNVATKPNIVVILCDDLGYGDVRALNPGSKIATPNIDRLAAQGVIFTDAHSSSAVCTPTRYSLLTGRYNWRSRLQSGVLGGMSPPLIEQNRITVASYLQSHGYHTACVGKWHLGCNWELLPGKPEFRDVIEDGKDGWNVDFSKPFRNGPLSYGFEYYFGISASLDMVPYAFLENDRVTELPTKDSDYPMMLGRKPNDKTRRGPTAASFDANQVLPRLTEKATSLISQWAEDSKAGKPFFLYVPFASPHTPIVPIDPWLGKSGINPYADFVMQTDDSVGRIMQSLEQYGVAENTLVIFTSDNGCSPQADLAELNKLEHRPSYVFRGAKADIFEGGHRVPFIARWPGVIAAGSRCDALIGLQDTIATCADVLGESLPAEVGEDSFSWLMHVSKPDGKNEEHGVRESLMHHSINGSFAIRRGKWKLCFCPDSGGWSKPTPKSKDAHGLPLMQLYDLEADVGETNNCIAEHPEIVKSLSDEMAELIRRGRSTSGPEQANTVPVKWQKP